MPDLTREDITSIIDRAEHNSHALEEFEIRRLGALALRQMVEIERLQAENARLREALGFYAEVCNWEPVLSATTRMERTAMMADWHGETDREWFKEFEAFRGGKRARAALAPKEENGDGSSTAYGESRTPSAPPPPPSSSQQGAAPPTHSPEASNMRSNPGYNESGPGVASTTRGRGSTLDEEG